MRCDTFGRQRVSGDLTNPFDELLREDVQWKNILLVLS
jgi:hypothetical protein